MAAPAIRTRRGKQTGWIYRGAMFTLAMLVAASPAIVLMSVIHGGVLAGGFSSVGSIVAEIPTLPELLAQVENLLLFRIHS